MTTAAAEVVIDRCPLTGRALSVRLPDGRVAFYQRREDDCFAAAIATLLQVHIADVPDPQIDAQLAAGANPDALTRQAVSELQAYLSGFGLRMRRRCRPPVERDGWLGVSPAPGRFQEHVVVMAYDEIAFDPASNWPCPPGSKVAPVVEIAGAITFDSLEDQVNELLLEDAVEDYPGRVRIVVDEDDAESQLGLIWSIRNRHYSSAATAATRFEAEALNPLDGAVKAALTGASGGTVVTHGTLSTNWTPVLDLRAGGTAYPTHTGTNRLWVRYRTTSGTAVQLRAVYDVGDLVLPVENLPIRCQGGTHLYMADLGELRLDPPPVGTHRWNAILQAKGDAGAENVSLDKIEVLNSDEGYGVLTAPLSADPGLVAASARDPFNQTAGNLVGKTLPVGGTWAFVVGDTDDFTVETTGKTAQRATTSDTAIRVVRATPTLIATAAQVDFKTSALIGVYHGLAARIVDASNLLYAYVQSLPNTQESNVWVYKRLSGSDVALTPSSGVDVGVLSPDRRYSLRLVVTAAGRLFVWFFPQDAAAGEPVFVTEDSVQLGTGGTLDDGGVGILDYNQSATAATRNYDNFLAWVPTLDAVLNPSQSCELRWDGMFREDVGGTAFGPVSNVIGDLPRLPPTVEGRTTEVFIKASRGDFGQLPDNGIDDISARITYRPCWLTVPGS